MRKFFATVFVAALLAASFVPVAMAAKSSHGHPFPKQNCGNDFGFTTFNNNNGNGNNVSTTHGPC